ncbi:hypothetical protein B0H34DRAFT_651785 [Crassisporium funariophilum]|nr:hypothetical protein B0H34DRAFT_651785 [Crassisporium funariophilum]
MDFLKNLNISDKKSEEHHSAPHPAAAAPKHDGSIFDKLTDALSGDHKSAVPSHVTSQTHAPTPPPTAAHQASFLGKIGDVIGSHGAHNTPPQPPVAVPQPKKDDGLFGKIGDVLGGHKTPPPPPVAQPKKEEGLFDKIGDALGGRKTPPPAAKKDEGLLGKLGDVISGKKDEPAAKPHGLADKLNHALGGGAKGEAEEGKLDKAIDMFQEHVLKEGPQHSESALEQAKDNSIADTIRNLTGIGAEKKH